MKKILIVDDKTEIRDLVETTLDMGDYELLQAENGRSAVEKAAEEKPDLIIMDVMMPGELDGLAATRKIKDLPGLKGCRIVMLTAKGQEIDREKGFEAGADDYFTKPFSPLDLIRKVEEILE